VTEDIFEKELLSKGGEEAAEWLDRASREGSPVLASFNWLGLAEVARSRISPGRGQAVPVAEAVAWAGVVSTAMDRVRHWEGLTDQYVDDYLLSLRCCMIATYGADRRNQWLDPMAVIEGFRTWLDLSLAEAAGMSSDWRSLARGEILRLRRIKNRLTPMALIRDVLMDCDEAAGLHLGEWFALLPQLP
jgi:hypothetical protein